MTPSCELSGGTWRQQTVIRPAPPAESKPLYPHIDISRYINTFSRLSFREDDSSRAAANDTQNEAISEAQAVNGTASVEDTSKIENDARAIADAETVDVPIQIRPAKPPRTHLQYQLDAKAFHQARKLSTGHPDYYWSHTMYRGPVENGKARHVKVHYCISKATFEYVCRKYFLGEPVLGFDLEWLAGASKDDGTRANVSLIQLASPSRIGLFHCSLFAKDDFVAPTFKEIMEDPSVFKTGVAIKADCSRLAKNMGVQTRGIYELSHFHKVIRSQIEGTYGPLKKSLVPLRLLVEQYTGLPLYKESSVRSSDWTKSLNSRQIKYSAADAYAGIQLYHLLEETRLSLDPPPERPHAAELGLPLPQLAKPRNADETSGDSSEEDTDTAGVVKGPEQTQARKVPKPSTKGDTKPKSVDSRIAAGELLAQKYREKKSRPVSVGPAALRAYYIWRSNDDMTPAAIAKLLRDPPLQTNTVITYILSSVTSEKLSFDKGRMKNELLAVLAPAALDSPKYQALVKQCTGN
ncbi:ribonuclease H-like domain-containing protein [Emericellopsis atlantica]|uniref:Ribonuclease H-like domain-containing protein n=1 Tax=Emericellopsis atlantica TaxID=2614577 RepID=A0A9P8CK77_9HYPO|nr:ribonuclease H-like domain-containing protein [Emericellopsis atlantica]KAG9250063.1 ribonuclease H-like domain-containing protein [Emericellopsis atlantica]